MPEGGFFFDPKVKTERDLHVWLGRAIPALSTSQRKHFLSNLYPSQFDGPLGYVDQDSHQIALSGNGIFSCNFLAVSEVFKEQSYACTYPPFRTYQSVSYHPADAFAVAPGMHTQDLSYTPDDPAAAPLVPQAQDTLQSLIESFAENGAPVPDGNGSTQFPAGVRTGWWSLLETMMPSSIRLLARRGVNGGVRHTSTE